MDIFRKMYHGFYPHIIITLLVILAYLPTFSGGFILDDNPLIKNNAYIKEIQSLSSYLIQEDGIVDRSNMGGYHTGYYRPLINLTYAIDYKLWGMNAPGFRVTNLILHLMTCFMLFQLIILIVDNREAAFWATILYCLHPVITESVAWVISRNNILVTLFSISSFYLYVICWKKRSYIAGICSLIFFLGAIFSKEFGLMLLPIYFLYHRLLSYEKRNVLSEISSYLPFIVVLVIYFFLRKNVVGAFLTPFDTTQLWQSISFIPYLIIWNLKLVFVPYGLHYFYLTYPSSIFHWQAILSIGLFLFLGIALWIKRGNRILVFSGLSFLIFLLPVLNIIPSASTLVTLVAMRWLYLPMAFGCFGVACLIKKVIAKSQVFTSLLMIIVIVYFGLYTYILNKNLWQDEYTFFRQEVIGFSNDFFAGDFAEKLFKNGDYQEAERYFKIALEKYPYQAYHFINYSALLVETGRPDSAISKLKEAKSLYMTRHEQGEWSNNMGVALLRLGKMDKALKAFQKSVVFAPDESAFWANLGGIYGMMGDYRLSEDTLKKGIDISPGSIQLWTNLVMTYINMKDYEKAILTLEKMPTKSEEDKKVVSRLFKLVHERLSVIQK